ncbi:MAG: T9SS type A sorting domain-containing protein [Saprospiraceae bacterium]
MKNFYSILILVVSFNILNAQVEFPILDARWCYNEYGDTNEDLGNFCLTAVELVEFNGKTYSQLEVTSSEFPTTSQGGMYREENRKFYFIPEGDTEEKLLYDFNLILGDTFVATYGFGVDDSLILEVEYVDTVITLDGISRKRITLTNNMGNYGIWLEGIGNLEWTTFIYPAYVASLSGRDDLTCHSQESATIYPSGGNPNCDIVISTFEFEENIYIEIYPNPMEDLINFDFNNFDARFLEIINFSGKVVFEKKINLSENDLQISNSLEAGIYFVKVHNQDGKVLTKKLIKI